MSIGNITLDKNHLNALVFGFLVLLLPVAVYLASNVSKDYTTKAAPSATIQLVPRGYTPVNGQYYFPPNTDVVVDIVMNTGASAEAEGYFYMVNYNPAVMTVGSSANAGCGEAIINADNSITVNALSLLRHTHAKEVTRNTSNQEVGTVGALCLGGPAPIAPLDIEARVPTNSTFTVGYIRFHTSSQVTTTPVSLSLSSTDTHIYEYGYLSNSNPIDSVEQNAPCDGDANTAKRACEDILLTGSLNPISINVGAAPTPTSVPPTSTPTSVPPSSTPSVPSSTPVPATQPTLELSTPSTTVTVNSTFDVQIRVDSAGKRIAGADVVFDFAPSLFQVVSVTPNTSQGSIFATFEHNPQYGNSYFSNTLGKVEISGLVDTANQTGMVATNALLATVRMQATALATNSLIAFNLNPGQPHNDCNIAEAGTGFDILSVTRDIYMTVVSGPTATPTTTPVVPTVTPTRTPTPTNTPVPPTNTPTPTATPVPPTATVTPGQPRPISVVLDLEGRGWKSGILNRIINLYVFQNGVEDVSKRVFNNSASVTDPITGTLSNRLTLNVGQTYGVVVHPKGYLNQETVQLITSSMTQFDLSTNPFHAGDIDGSGKVNLLDYNEILSRFKKVTTNIIGATDDEITDLDGSGQINSLDFSLLLSNFNQCGAYEDSNSDGVLDTKFGTGNPC